MIDPIEFLKLLADPTRLRLIHLLVTEELSVAELQEILDMGQSRISSHLALLRQGSLVLDRREGKRSFYAISKQLTPQEKELLKASLGATAQTESVVSDKHHLERILERRRKQSEHYFNEVAGRLGKNYCPGRSWEAIGHALLHLTPFIDIADLGAGEGVFSQLLARRAKSVHCIDNSPRMVEVGIQLAKEHGFDNLFYKLGDIEAVPLEDESVDLVLLSQALHHAQHPNKAIDESQRILRKGGQIIILDLMQHQFEKARELYADQWLGFSHNNLYRWLRDAHFENIAVETVTKETQEPYFETILATAQKG